MKPWNLSSSWNSALIDPYLDPQGPRLVAWNRFGVKKPSVYWVQAAYEYRPLIDPYFVRLAQDGATNRKYTISQEKGLFLKQHCWFQATYLCSTLKKTELIFISIHYWQRYWAEKGIKILGRTHRIRFSRFPGRPRGFRAARGQKPLKHSQNLPKLTKFTMFFVSSCPKTTWSTWKP